MATIKDVAREAGVSVTTVSATINMSAPVSAELRARVMAAVEAVGYKPSPIARNLRLGQSRLVGLLVPDIASPYASSIARSLQRALSDKGYSLFFSSTQEDFSRELADIDRMSDHRVAGLALLPTCLGEDYAARLARHISCPAVIMDRVIAGTLYDSVADDNALGARIIVRHLVQLGHRDIAMIAGRTGITSSDERLDGIAAALADAGLSLAPELTVTHHQSEELAIRAVQDLMSRARRPSAIVTINSAQVRGAVQALRSMHFRAPDDVSLIAFDDFHYSAGFDPEITSLTQDIKAIAGAAAEMLVERVELAKGETPPPPRLCRFAPTLIVRSSCRAV
ncbi:MAG: LacI family DNA-binding transcriptional regulator [Acuticoccus sp.]